MAESLKDATSKPLLVVMAANVAVFYAGVQTGSLFSGDWLALVREWAEALPAGLGITPTGIINAQLPSDAKARLVCWQWQDSLPGCEAFSRDTNGDVMHVYVPNESFARAINMSTFYSQKHRAYYLIPIIPGAIKVA